MFFIGLMALLDLRNFGEMSRTLASGHRSAIIRGRPMPHQWPHMRLPKPLFLGSLTYCVAILPCGAIFACSECPVRQQANPEAPNSTPVA